MHGGIVLNCGEACSKIVSRCLDAIVNVPACKQLAQHVRDLCAILPELQKMEDMHVLPPDAQQLVKTLEHDMQNISKLVSRAGNLPRMYRIVNASKMSSDFKSASQAAGTTLQDLHSVLLSGNGTLQGDLRSLGIELGLMDFPMQPRECEIYEESQRIASRVYGNEITMMEGVRLLRGALEQVLGKENIETDWKLVAKHLFGDMDAAHNAGDLVQAQRTRLLQWAMAGPQSAPPEFYCPIALEIMEDPVVLMETAVTYDRKSVEVWISPHGPQRCPVTRKKLSNPSFIENKSLKILIDDWRRETGLEEGARHESNVFAPLGMNQTCGAHTDESDFQDLDGSPTEESIERSPEASSNALVVSTVTLPQENNSYPVGHLEAPAHPKPGSVAIPALVLPIHSTPPRFDRPNSNDLDMPGHHYRTYTHDSSGSSFRPPQFDFSDHSTHAHELEQIFSPGSGTQSSILPSTQRTIDRRAIKEMLIAAEHGDLDCLLDYAEEGKRLDECNEDGETPLHFAAGAGHLAIVEFLLSRGVNINARLHTSGVTPLYLAACNGQDSVVGLLLAHDANIMITNKSGWSPLHAAIDTGHTISVSLLLEYAQRERHVMYPTLATEAGWTSLHYAVRKGDIETIELLLPFFPHINHKCNAGFTPLHVAVDTGHAEVTQLLLKANPDPNAQSDDGWTVLHAAQDSNNVEIGRMLLQAGADPDVSGQDGITPLHRAAFQNHLDFARLLVEEGNADLNRKTQPEGGFGRKAIEIASDLNHIELYSYIFKRRMKNGVQSLIGRARSRATNSG